MRSKHQIIALPFPARFQSHFCLLAFVLAKGSKYFVIVGTLFALLTVYSQWIVPLIPALFFLV